ncbi:MAG TPA: hypothetical protein PKD72_14565, partial [Gemmatales bacterium]|nr:hypothetical protein [Gemmatales bacterium]
MKRRVAGFLLAVAATGSGCMTNDGFSHQHMGMQNGAMRLASSEHGPVPVHGYNPAMMSGGFMPGGSKNTPSPIMQVGYAGGDGGILQAGGCAGGACALPGAPPMGGFGGGFDGIGGDPGCYTTGGRVHSFGHLPGGAEANLSAQRTQVKFVGPINAKVGWYVQGPDGRPVLSTGQITMPGRYNFAQAAIYSLKISDIQGRPGVELYPTIEV